MRRVLLLVIAALAATLGGCGSTETTALEVNGTEIDQEQFSDALEALAIEGTGDGTVAITVPPDSSGQGATTVADQLVDVALIQQELDARGVEPSEEDRQLAEAQIPEDTPDLSADARDLLIEWGEERVALLRALFAEAVDPEALLCLRVILVADEAAAQEVLTELSGGADFAELSAERSTDPGLAQTGGDLGCQSDTFRPELQQAAADLAIGDIGGPVTLEFGSVVLQRTEPTFEGTAPTINDTILNPILQQARIEADVDIDPRYGRWDEEADPPQVAPPEGPVEATTSTTTPAPSPFQPPAAPDQTAPGTG